MLAQAAREANVPFIMSGEISAKSRLTMVGTSSIPLWTHRFRKIYN